MTLFCNVSSCCTALHMDGLGGEMDNWATKTILNWLENDIDSAFKGALGSHYASRHVNGFALFFAISTEEQECSRTLKKLGFQECYTAEKSHNDSRETDSGALTVWCVQPWDFLENRANWIKELKEGDKPNAEEISRRQQFDEFRITQYQNSEVMKPLLNEKRLYRADIVPSDIATRNRIFSLVTTLTGGFEPSKDTELLPMIMNRQLTWGDLKDRAIRWRNGEFK